MEFFGLSQWIHEVEGLDARILWLVILGVLSVIILDVVFKASAKVQKKAGLEASSPGSISVEKAEGQGTKTYVSERLGLSGTPDGIVEEEGYLIPIERKPLAKRVRDRYVAQLLVYLRLIEECEGVRPPYGYLILGSECKRIKIDNTLERQAWLDSLIKEMQNHLEGEEVIPSPHPMKCRKCPVRVHCDHKLTPTS